MLENVPRRVGKVLRRMRSGAAELIINDEAIHHVKEIIEVTSPVFEGGECIPTKYTADGEGLSRRGRRQSHAQSSCARDCMGLAGRGRRPR